MLPKTKCPCENCLLIPACNNRNPIPAINAITSINTCSLLKDFLNISRVSRDFTSFDSNLSREELQKKLDQLDLYIPIDILHILK